MKTTAATPVRLIPVFAFASLMSLVSHADAQKTRKVTIGIVLDGASVQNTRTFEEIAKQVKKLAGNTYDIRFPTDKVIDGQFDAAKIAAGLDKLLRDPGVTMVYALGTVASHTVGQRQRLSKPVIAPFVIDRKLQGMPFDKGKSGRKNLNYLDWPWSLERDLAVFDEVAAPKKVVVLASELATKAIPQLGAQAMAAAKQVGFQLSVVPVGNSIESALQAIPAGTDGVYLAPLPQLTPADAARLQAQLTKRRLSSFALLGERAVHAGALVGRLPNEALSRIARRVALHTVRILGGQNASQLSVALQLPERVFINMKTARALGLSPSWQVLTEAELIATGRTGIKRNVTLQSVIEEALDGNLTIKASKQAVIAGRATLSGARASLLPAIDLSSDGRLIDKDRAESAFGNSPEVLVNGSITVNQLLFSERAWGAYSAEKHLQKRRKQQLVQTKWDVIAQVGAAYITVLRTKSAERIQRNNLKVTRSNLELARIRVDAGSSNRADVYRWEVQIANDRKGLIEASAQRNVAEIDLQRILHRPPEERFTTKEIALPSHGLSKYLRDPQSFRLLRDFLVAEAIARAPEVKQLNAAITAQERALTSARRALYAPTVGLQASATQRFYKGGAGSGTPMGSTANSREWFVGLNLSIPLYEGGRYAEITRNQAEVTRLTRERDAVRDQIAQRAASQLHQAGASFAGIRLAKNAEQAAKKNFELISLAYTEGAVRVVDLLDAQSAWVSAQRVAADSTYGFLIDWINVQRAVGQFSMLTPDNAQDLARRAERYIANRKAERDRAPANKR